MRRVLKAILRVFAVPADDPGSAREYLDELARHAGKRWERGKGEQR